MSTDARQYREGELLRNGLEVLFRAARPEDAERVVEAFEKLEADSIYMRFFGPKKGFSEEEIQRFRETDFDTRVILLCTTERDGREIVIGSGTYIRTSEDSAEAAFAVEEDYQRLGISRRLLAHLGRIGRAKGLKTFTAEVLPYNSPMLGLFRTCGWPMQSKTAEGVVHVTLDLEPVIRK